MSCGCGGKCCDDARGPLASVTGLAVLGTRRSSRGLGFLSWESGGGDWWDENDLTPEEYGWLLDTYGGGGGWGGWNSPGWWDVSGGGYGLDFWGLDDPAYWDYYGYSVGPAYTPGGPSFNFDPNWQPSGFLPTNQQPSGGGLNWQELLDWWAGLTRPRTPIEPSRQDTSTLPPYSGYCPPNTYCVDFPTCSRCAPLDDSTPSKKPGNTAKKPAARQAKPKTSPQNPQPCPAPGRTNPATGRCVCPQGMIYDASKKACVPDTLGNRLVAPAGDTGIPWWVILLGGVVVGGAVFGRKTETTTTVRKRRL